MNDCAQSATGQRRFSVSENIPLNRLGSGRWDSAGNKSARSTLPPMLFVPVDKLVVNVALAVGALFAELRTVELARLPFKTPSFAVWQHWHGLFHHDPHNSWLRGQGADLFSEATDEWIDVEEQPRQRLAAAEPTPWLTSSSGSRRRGIPRRCVQGSRSSLSCHRDRRHGSLRSVVLQRPPDRRPRASSVQVRAGVGAGD